MCHFLFHTTVLQILQSRIHRPNILFKKNLSALSFLLDPDPEQIFRIQDKVPDPQHCLQWHLFIIVLVFQSFPRSV